MSKRRDSDVPKLEVNRQGEVFAYADGKRKLVTRKGYGDTLPMRQRTEHAVALIGARIRFNALSPEEFLCWAVMARAIYDFAERWSFTEPRWMRDKTVRMRMQATDYYYDAEKFFLSGDYELWAGALHLEPEYIKLCLKECDCSPWQWWADKKMNYGKKGKS